MPKKKLKKKPPKLRTRHMGVKVEKTKKEKRQSFYDIYEEWAEQFNKEDK